MQGDILFLHMSKDPIRTGEIVVFNIDVSATLVSFYFYQIYIHTFITFLFNNTFLVPHSSFDNLVSVTAILLVNQCNHFFLISVH